MTPTERVSRWLQSFIIGRNICPFARLPWQQGVVHLSESPVREPEAMARAILGEIALLLDHSRQARETTLLLFPETDLDFPDFLDVVYTCEELVEGAGLAEELQLIAFHPEFQFADTPLTDPGNAVNRSPVPLVHILRQVSINEAVDQHPNVADIPDRNAELLRGLGPAEIKRMSKEWGENQP